MIKKLIHRDSYMDKLLAHKDNELIKIITGIRRCGKSMLLELFKDHLIHEGVLQTNIISINFERMQYDEIRDYQSFYTIIKEQLPKSGKCYLLLDEIQQVEHWEKAVTSLSIEADVDIYITGSNAYLLSSEIATLLSGRFVEIKMLPLSFKEYLLFDHLPVKWTLEEKFSQYLKYGGFPLIPSLPQNNTTINEYLLGIYNSVIVKDIISRNRIKDVSQLERIIKFIITNTGSFISPNKISGYLSSQKKGESIKNATVSNYLEILEKAYIVYQVSRFDIRGKESLKTLSKYYVADTGIRNMLCGYSDSDMGHVLETVVYFELLRRGYEVFVGKWYDMEVDFVAQKQDDRRYYQVTYSLMNEEVKHRELRPLKAIPDNYRKYVVSMDTTYVTDHEGIMFVNAVDFLLSEE